MIRIPNDFKAFLRLLNAHGVEYLLVGGYAVGLHGYPRPTGDIDFWVATTESNADRVIAAIREFGFDPPSLVPSLLTERKQILRMGIPPYRIEVICTISGVEFAECYQRRVAVDLDGVEVQMICLDDLKANKLASGREKDLVDLKYLPD